MGTQACKYCGKDCITFCPYCKEVVHQQYGQWNDDTCSLKHESSCSGAKSSRDLRSEQVPVHRLPGRGGPDKENNREEKYQNLVRQNHEFASHLLDVGRVLKKLNDSINESVLHLQQIKRILRIEENK